jgi:small subunit ribosomal protein S20
VKKARRLLTEGNKEEAQAAVARAVGALDRAVVRGIIHKNNAARSKSRLIGHLNNL